MCSENNNYQSRKWEQTVLQTNYLQTQNVAFFVFLFHKVKVYFALRTLENSQTGGFLMHFSKNCFFQWPFNKSRPLRFTEYTHLFLLQQKLFSFVWSRSYQKMHSQHQKKVLAQVEEIIAPVEKYAYLKGEKIQH